MELTVGACCFHNLGIKFFTMSYRTGISSVIKFTFSPSPPDSAIALTAIQLAFTLWFPNGPKPYLKNEHTNQH